MNSKVQIARYENTISYCIMIMVAGILFWRAKYGFIWSDEPYYFETAYRFMQGDKPIINDWYTAQIYSVILVPYMRLMRFILGEGFTGLFLISRYLYVFIQLLVGIICYRVFSKSSKIAALIGSIVFMLYCRANICTISYYSVCSASLCVALMLAYNEVVYANMEGTKLKDKCLFIKVSIWILIGILWGIAIICNPYLAILYIVYYLFLIIYIFRMKNNYGYAPVMLIGTAVIGFLFIYYVLRDVQVADIITGITYVMSDEAYYGSGSILYKFFSGFLYIAYRFRYTILFSIISAAALVVINRKRKLNSISFKTDAKYSLLLLVLNTVILALDVLLPAHSAYTMGTCMAALAVWGIQVYLISDKEYRALFAMMYIPGILAALLMAAASDTRFSATTQGLMIAAVASVIIGIGILRCAKIKYAELLRIGNRKRIACIFLTAICIILLGTSFYDRIFLVYRDREIGQLSEELQEGPAKGIITTNECEKRYDSVWDTVSRISRAEGNLYIMNFCPWAYLATSMRCSPYTAWRIMPDMDDTMGQSYYEVHPDKFPDIVLRLANEYTEYGENVIDNDGIPVDMDAPEQNSLDEEWNNSKIVTELYEEGYRIVEVPCGRMYIRNSSEYEWISEELFTEKNK